MHWFKIFRTYIILSYLQIFMVYIFITFNYIFELYSKNLQLAIEIILTQRVLKLVFLIYNFNSFFEEKFSWNGWNKLLVNLITYLQFYLSIFWSNNYNHSINKINIFFYQIYNKIDQNCLNIKISAEYNSFWEM